MSSSFYILLISIVFFLPFCSLYLQIFMLPDKRYIQQKKYKYLAYKKYVLQWKQTRDLLSSPSFYLSLSSKNRLLIVFYVSLVALIISFPLPSTSSPTPSNIPGIRTPRQFCLVSTFIRTQTTTHCFNISSVQQQNHPDSASRAPSSVSISPSGDSTGPQVRRIQH